MKARHITEGGTYAIAARRKPADGLRPVVVVGMDHLTGKYGVVDADAGVDVDLAVDRWEKFHDASLLLSAREILCPWSEADTWLAAHLARSTASSKAAATRRANRRAEQVRRDETRELERKAAAERAGASGYEERLIEALNAMGGDADVRLTVHEGPDFRVFNLLVNGDAEVLAELVRRIEAG